MKNFPETPPLGNMERKDRMDRLCERLMGQGLYVRPVCLDETHAEWGYFIVAVDDPYLAIINRKKDGG